MMLTCLLILPLTDRLRISWFPGQSFLSAAEILRLRLPCPIKLVLTRSVHETLNLWNVL